MMGNISVSLPRPQTQNAFYSATRQSSNMDQLCLHWIPLCTNRSIRWTLGRFLFFFFRFTQRAGEGRGLASFGPFVSSVSWSSFFRRRTPARSREPPWLSLADTGHGPRCRMGLWHSYPLSNLGTVQIGLTNRKSRYIGKKRYGLRTPAEIRLGQTRLRIIGRRYRHKPPVLARPVRI